MLGLVLCAVALADLGLVWLLWWWSLACRADASLSR